MKKILRLLAAALCLLPAAALGSVWQGSVEAARTAEVRATADGILERVPLRPGEWVTADTEAAVIRESRVFAPFDGRVNGIRVLEGEEAAGQTVLTVEPVSPYDVYCSVKDAYKTVENTRVSGGQRVWIRCSADGSHRAVGRVTTVDGLDFHVEILGGELFIGESVFVYREGSFKDGDRLGTGTVLESEETGIRATGVILSLRVTEGEEVERGQLLFTLASSDELTARCGAEGWVTEVLVQAGGSAKENDILARVATQMQLSVEAGTADAAALREGTELSYWRADDPHTLHACRVTRVLKDVGSEKLTAVLEPLEETDLPVGLTVYVTDEKE